VLSPGPCTPDQAGICLAVVRELGGVFPILGVCLGHQTIGQAFGGKVVGHARSCMARPHRCTIPGQGVFAGLDNPFQATRYHSLIVERASLPECLEETAWTELDGQRDEIMGFRHRTLKIEGVQFHPESILTRHGHDLLKNFLDLL
jgi:anthranilate synthase/aminodeoxychorismate synthase-like glutamine amidotransferase